MTNSWTVFGAIGCSFRLFHCNLHIPICSNPFSISYNLCESLRIHSNCKRLNPKKSSIIGAQRAFEGVAGGESELLQAVTMEPGLFPAAGSPQEVMIRFFDQHNIKADGTGSLMIPHFWNFLDWMVVVAIRLIGPKVLVDHLRLESAGKVVGSLACLVAATHSSTSFMAFKAL